MGMRTSHSRYGTQKVQDKKNYEEITVIIIITTVTRRYNNCTKAGVIISPILQVRKRRLRKVKAFV